MTLEAERDVRLSNLSPPATPRISDMVGQALADVGAGTPPTTSHSGWPRQYARALIASDLALSLLAALIAYMVRFGDVRGDADTTWYAFGSLSVPFLLVGSFAAGRAYEPRFLANGSEELRRMANAAIRLGALVAIVAVGLKVDIARGYVLIALPLSLLLCTLGRLGARKVLVRMRARGACLHRVVVVGRERSVAELIRTVKKDSSAGFEVVAACLETTRPRDSSQVEGVPIRGGTADVLAAVRASDADAVAITAFSDLDNSAVRRLGWQLEGTDVAMLVAPRITDVAGPRIHVRPVGGLPLLQVEQPEFTGSRRVFKALIDRTVAAALLVLLAPLLLVVALVVRLTNPGPAVFRQTRVGTHGQTFTLWKFRSMRVSAEHELSSLLADNHHGAGPLFKMAADPRITSVGRFLRRYSLDELPQLVQVVTGKMSLVGPRPPLPSEVMRYENMVHRRLLVKPGLTGLWQISGRSTLSWEDSVRLDLHYVENWSLALDVTILWKTLAAVLGRKGAY